MKLPPFCRELEEHNLLKRNHTKLNWSYLYSFAQSVEHPSIVILSLQVRRVLLLEIHDHLQQLGVWPELLFDNPDDGLHDTIRCVSQVAANASGC